MEPFTHPYDLTYRMTPFMDRHLVLMIYNHLTQLMLYEEIPMTKAQLSLLQKTAMVDYTVELCQMINQEVDNDLLTRRELVLDTIHASREKCINLLERLEDPKSYEQIKTFKSFQDMYDEWKLEDGILKDLVAYAINLYKSGHYKLCHELLKWNYKLEKINDAEVKKNMSAVWGALASVILQNEWCAAADFVIKLDDLITSEHNKQPKNEMGLPQGTDTNKKEKNEMLLHRTWFAHWALFILFRVDWSEAKTLDAADHQSLVYNWNKLLDIFLHEKNVSVICLTAPHLLRYVGALLILHNKRLKLLLTDVAKIMHQEAEVYQDPITKFLLAVFHNMDFQEAQKQMPECKEACEIDYFLCNHWKAFEDNARLLIFESYCRVHQFIDIGMISQKLNMDPEDAEQWMVKLIKTAGLHARIDSEKNRVIMAKDIPTVYQQIIDKTKNISFRTTLVQANVASAKKIADRKKESADSNVMYR